MGTLAQVDKGNLAMTEHERGSAAMADLPNLARRPRERSIFRVNKAKGPNPLAVQSKKKRRRAEGEAQQQKEQSVAAEMPKRKRARVRRKAGVGGEQAADAAAP
jgi:hypothetical protein